MMMESSLANDRHLATVDARTASGWGGRWYGVLPAQVSALDDPDGQGRVKVKLPWSPDAGGEGYEAWARMATLFAGRERGSWFLPEVGDEVLVAFEQGDPRRPYVLGGLWNGQDKPPASLAGGVNKLKVIKSRRGVTVTLDDSDGQERLKLETPGGQSITLKDGPGSIEITDSNGNTMKFEASGITITATAKLTINAPQTSVSSGIVKVDAGMSKFSGVVQADTVISNSVISASYTPGAGNIW
jgi:uncharacterized protein involved in type VI secretion and phage assembly